MSPYKHTHTLYLQNMFNKEQTAVCFPKIAYLSLRWEGGYFYIWDKNDQITIKLECYFKAEEVIRSFSGTGEKSRRSS